MNIMHFLNWLVIICVLKCYTTAADRPCAAREGDPGQGRICVCNSSYCDTVDRPPKLSLGQFHLYSTSNSTPGFTHTTGRFYTDTESENNYDELFTVNNDIQYQEIIGFGGSFSDSTGIVINSLPAEAQTKLIESYFGTNGVEYTFCRIPIGGTDFSGRPFYSLDDVPFDDELEHFSLTLEDYEYKIPFIKKAMAVSDRGMKFYGCAWNSPQWMKTSYDEPLGGAGYLKREYWKIYAQYHVRFIEEYKRNDIDIWALSGGNEVILGVMVGLNCTQQLAHMQREWLKNYLSPALKASNLSEVKFLGMDDVRMFGVYWMDRVSVDPEAYKLSTGIALHWYFDFYVPPVLLDILHWKYPEQLIVYTESSINPMFFAEPGEAPVLFGSWGRAALYIHNIIENLNHWANGYIDWNLALNTEGGPYIYLALDAAVIVNNVTGEFYKQPMFYAMGHFSKFIPPGSKRVQVITGQNHSTVDYISYTNNEITYTPQYLQLSKTVKNLKKNLKIKPDLPPIIAPEIIECVATANSDGSYSVIILNNKNLTSKVRLNIAPVGSVTLTLEEKSLNTLVYWL